MGTRNLTAVYLNGEVRVAQYGQWDGYLEGAGYKVLDFCRKYLSTPQGIETFVSRVSDCTFVNEDSIIQAYESVGIDIKKKDGWVNLDEAERFKKAFPALDRDMGCDVLDYIMSVNQTPIYLRNSIKFSEESLFCEYAYVIDLDTCELEIYCGFRKEPNTAVNRFRVSEPDRSGYYAVELLEKYSLSSLPSREELLKLEGEDDND